MGSVSYVFLYHPSGWCPRAANAARAACHLSAGLAAGSSRPNRPPFFRRRTVPGATAELTQLRRPDRQNHLSRGICTDWSPHLYPYQYVACSRNRFGLRWGRRLRLHTTIRIRLRRLGRVLACRPNATAARACLVLVADPAQSGPGCLAEVVMTGCRAAVASCIVIGLGSW